MQPQYTPKAHNFRDLTGQRFGRLIALRIAGKRKQGQFIWLCKCDCGQETEVTGTHLSNGNTTSCGCYNAKATHRMTRTPIYQVWAKMVQRCTNPANQSFAEYGGRGILCHQEWCDSFEAFYAHVAQLDNYGEKGYSLDRIDNNRGYEPGNVRWSTWKTQGRNRRTNHLITYDGITMSVTEWAEYLKIDPRTLHARLNFMKWDVERAFTTPVQKHKK